MESVLFIQTRITIMQKKPEEPQRIRTEPQNHSLLVALTEYLTQIIIYVKCLDQTRHRSVMKRKRTDEMMSRNRDEHSEEAANVTRYR